MQNRYLDGELSDWSEPDRPGRLKLSGRYAKLEPLSVAEHSEQLFSEFSADDSIWDYMFDGPYSNISEFQSWVERVEENPNQVFLAIRDREAGIWGGVASFMRIKPDMGVIEVGSINYSPVLQQTRAATEAMYLMMKWVFQAGYRRYEWKCNALNIRSCRAAQRYGFSYEGIFRQAMVVKGRNRDTAWFAIVDSEWPDLKRAFETWLSADNFDSNGQQIVRLRDLTSHVLVQRDPRLT